MLSHMDFYSYVNVLFHVLSHLNLYVFSLTITHTSLLDSVTVYSCAV